MKKTLNSGIIVDSNEYYKLLEWKDKNLEIYGYWCNERKLVSYSIQDLGEKYYNELVKFAEI